MRVLQWLWFARFALILGLPLVGLDGLWLWLACGLGWMRRLRLGLWIVGFACGFVDFCCARLGGLGLVLCCFVCGTVVPVFVGVAFVVGVGGVRFRLCGWSANLWCLLVDC